SYDSRRVSLRYLSAGLRYTTSSSSSSRSGRLLGNAGGSFHSLQPRTHRHSSRRSPKPLCFAAHCGLDPLIRWNVIFLLYRAYFRCILDGVSKVAMVTSLTLIYKMLFSSIFTCETPPDISTNMLCRTRI